MIRVADTEDIVTQFLRKVLKNHDSIVATLVDGSSYTVPTTYIKHELFPFLKYGLAKIDKNLLNFSVNGAPFYVIVNGIPYIHKVNCEAYVGE